jgi:hypothetical protein
MAHLQIVIGTSFTPPYKVKPPLIPPPDGNGACVRGVLCRFQYDDFLATIAVNVCQLDFVNRKAHRRPTPQFAVVTAAVANDERLVL